MHKVERPPPRPLGRLRNLPELEALEPTADPAHVGACRYRGRGETLHQEREKEKGRRGRDRITYTRCSLFADGRYIQVHFIYLHLRQTCHGSKDVPGYSPNAAIKRGPALDWHLIASTTVLLLAVHAVRHQTPPTLLDITTYGEEEWSKFLGASSV